MKENAIQTIKRNRPDQGQHYGVRGEKVKLLSREAYQIFPQPCIPGFWYEKLQFATGAILIVNLSRHIC